MRRLPGLSHHISNRKHHFIAARDSLPLSHFSFCKGSMLGTWAA